MYVLLLLSFFSLLVQTPSPTVQPKQPVVKDSDADESRKASSAEAKSNAAPSVPNVSETPTKPLPDSKGNHSQEESQDGIYRVKVISQPSATDAPLFMPYLIATALGVIVNAAILYGILRQNKINWRQVRINVRAARAAKRSAEAALRGIRLQEIQLKQWISIEDFQATTGRLDRAATEARLSILYHIRNPTGMPLTIDWVVFRIGIREQKQASVLKRNLGPGESYPMRTFTVLREARLDLYRQYTLGLNIIITVGFTDAFENARKQMFGSHYRCGPPAAADPSPYEGPWPDDEIEPQENEESNKNE